MTEENKAEKEETTLEVKFEYSAYLITRYDKEAMIETIVESWDIKSHAEERIDYLKQLIEKGRKVVYDIKPVRKARKVL
jgi:hypothetical protein